MIYIYVIQTCWYTSPTTITFSPTLLFYKAPKMTLLCSILLLPHFPSKSTLNGFSSPLIYSNFILSPWDLYCQIQWLIIFQHLRTPAFNRAYHTPFWNFSLLASGTTHFLQIFLWLFTFTPVHALFPDSILILYF